MEAAATGAGSKSRKRRSSVFPSSSSITRSACSNGNGLTSSCSPRSSTTMSGGTTSGRVERSWPNFTNVGPSSSSTSRRCWPRAEEAPCSAATCVRRSSAERPGRRSLSLCASRKYPKPCFTMTCAISDRRPMLRVVLMGERLRGASAGGQAPAGLAPPRPRSGRYEQRLGMEVGEPDRGQVRESLDADVAAPPLREELAVERVEPLELEDVVGEQQATAHDPAGGRRHPV